VICDRVGKQSKLPKMRKLRTVPTFVNVHVLRITKALVDLLHACVGRHNQL